MISESEGDNMQEKTVLPLHETVHYRRLRETITLIAKNYNIDLSKYNLNKIRCYRTIGNDLIGSNCKFVGISPNASCFVENNCYEIYECPCTTNKHAFVGKYLLFVKNASYNYYLLVEMDYSVSAVNGKARTNVIYRPIACCGMTVSGNKITIDKWSKNDLENGNNLKTNAKFIWRSNAYNYNDTKYVEENCKHFNNEFLTNKNETVKIYKKNKKTKK